MKRITTYSRPVGRGAASGIKKLIVCDLVVVLVVVIKLKSTSGWFYGDEATPGLRQPLQQGTVTTSNARHTAMDPSAGNPGKKYMGILPTGKRPGQGRRLAAWSVRSAVCALRCQWHHRVRGLFSSLRRLSVMWDRPSSSTQEPGDCGGRLHGGVVLQVGIPSAQELICDGLS